MSPFWIKKHPPHPPGARRVKLLGCSPLNQKIEPPLPPAGPKLEPGRTQLGTIIDIWRFRSAFFFVSFLGCLFSSIFRNVDDYWLRFGFHFGPCSFNSAYLFRTLFSHAFSFFWFALISEALNPLEPLFYFSKSMIYGKPTQRGRFKKIFDFLPIFELLLGPRLA